METGFGRWMRAHPRLASEKGIVRTDTDHTILRYKTHEQGRAFQLMIDIEVKENGSSPDLAQRDVLLMKNQMVSKNGHNVYEARTKITQKILSVLSGKRVNVRHLGIHLLQFEKTNPDDSAWIRWNHREISKDQLVDILALDVDPRDPERSMMELLRDRHRRDTTPDLLAPE
jgi:hypothetical protein